MYAKCTHWMHAGLNETSIIKLEALINNIRKLLVSAK